MSDTPVIFLVVLGLGFGWVMMMSAIFDRLKAKHPNEFKAMGEPSMFWNSSMKNHWAFWSFAARRDHKGLDDRVLSLLCDATLVVFAAFWVFFFVAFFSGGSASR